MSTSSPPASVDASGSSRRRQQAQNQVDEEVDMMRVSLDRVLERDQKLCELDNLADTLRAGASQFEMSVAKLKRNDYWWKNCKVWVILITTVIVIILVVEYFFMNSQ
ncbi:vesicle-associated membrane protein 3-like [Trichosurus vulpecula]|uniref:vesicle-associated membrane protein 3-like n=1 Tax=Trichosurus vulpecula TaxID=9337 RepID=UPI00186AEBFB|nr:vesicle-associated membrane protein 3-like [Trichosurus vulpecula]